MKKKLLALLSLALGAIQSQAAVTFDNATQSFAGTFDLTPYYSAIGIIITAIAIVAAISLALSKFRSVR